ncbi:MAG TPA: S53 family peptidase [Caulobacteraceae bacterium]|jgi:kumamolisin
MATRVRRFALKTSVRAPMAGAVALGRTDAGARLSVLLKLRRKRPLDPLAAAAAGPMSHDELAAEHGASEADVAATVAACEDLGLEVARTDPATRSVIASGSVAAMEAAFDVRLFDYDAPAGPYRGRVGALRLPAALKGIVVGVFGLDNRRVARRLRRPNPLDGAGTAAAPTRTPQQLAARYRFPPGDGAGQTIALLEFGGGYFPADLEAFCQQTAVAAPSEVITVSADGSPTDALDGLEGEVMLDVEVAAGGCPGAKLALYFGAWSDAGWLAALDAALQDKVNQPSVISISWGASEDGDLWTAQAIEQMSESLKDAAALHITVCAGSGDDGSSNAETDERAHVSFPASSPLVLAVGGTTVPSDAAADVVWKAGNGLKAFGGGSSGGGVSAVCPRPAWQSGIAIASVNAGAIVGRVLPDLAANADWTVSPYFIIVSGAEQPSGGTSAATPLVAALIARINQARLAAGQPRVGYLTPKLYEANGASTVGAAACTPVTGGDNATGNAGGYAANGGFSAVTGWGVPNGEALAALI